MHEIIMIKYSKFWLKTCETGDNKIEIQDIIKQMALKSMLCENYKNMVTQNHNLLYQEKLKYKTYEI